MKKYKITLRQNIDIFPQLIIMAHTQEHAIQIAHEFIDNGSIPHADNFMQKLNSEEIDSITEVIEQ